MSRKIYFRICNIISNSEPVPTNVKTSWDYTVHTLNSSDIEKTKDQIGVFEFY